MKKIALMVALNMLLFFAAMSQTVPAGTVVVAYINAKSLQANKGYEVTKRRVSIYLPPGYDAHKKYPVIYYLHGFTWSDSLEFAADHMNQLLDKAIAQKRIRPFIMVTPNEKTLYGGSFYTNSAVNGNWADFTANELVDYIDSHYSTIKSKYGRGLAGHSMGGHGALKIALLYPDRFCAVYALSPGLVAANKEWMQDKADAALALNATSAQQIYKNFNAVLIIAVARAFSPNVNKPPFYCDLPFSKSADTLIANDEVLKKWNANTPLEILGDHPEALRGLKGLAFDWGASDQFKHNPIAARAFADRLSAFGIPFTAEEYDGNHTNRIMGDDGRIMQHLLPFFDKYLTFQ